MNFVKKTILLSNDKNELAVLNIFKEDNNTFGGLKHCNFNSNNLILGISVNNKQILKQNLVLNNGTYNFKFNNAFDINSNIGCVIVDKNDNHFTPIVWGNNNDIVDYKAFILNNFESEINKTNFSKIESDNKNSQKFSTNPEVKKVLSDFDNKAKELNDINIAINNEETKFFNNENAESVNVSSKEKIQKKLSPEEMFDDSNIDDVISESLSDSNSGFFDMISEQIEDIFLNNPKEEKLENLIPNSKWVKVNFDEMGKQYVIGLVYDEGVLKYICYGVPSTYDVNPLKDMEEYCQWVPLDKDESNLDGYWIIFQDANSGESLKC